MKIWDYFISFISCEYFISFILGLIASFIGVLASIEYEKRKSKKEKRELQDKQWKTLNKIMHDVQDWAYTLKDNPNYIQYPERYISPQALFNKLSCDEIPIKYKDQVFEIACSLENIQYEISLQNPNPDNIKLLAELIYEIAKKLAKENNPEKIKELSKK